MSAPSADAIAAVLPPHEIADWIECAKYTAKTDPAGWLWSTVVRKGARRLPAAFVKHRDALRDRDRERERIALARSEVDARRAMPPPEAPPIGAGKTRAGLPPHLRKMLEAREPQEVAQ